MVSQLAPTGSRMPSLSKYNAATFSTGSFALSNEVYGQKLILDLIRTSTSASRMVLRLTQ